MIAESRNDRKQNHTTPRAWYGWLYERHGIFLQAQGTIQFRDSETETWQEVDLATLTRWAVLNGECALADAQQLRDGDRVRNCSHTLQIDVLPSLQ